MYASNTDVVSKIAKLLSLSKSSNEHEAALALSAAQKLLDKHNISMSDVEVMSDEIVERYIQPTKPGSSQPYRRLPGWNLALGMYIAQFGYCQFLYTNQYFKFIGSKTDVNASVEMYNYLYKTVKQLMKTYTNTHELHNRKNVTSSYAVGAVHAIYSTMKAISDREEALKTSDGTDLIVLKNHQIEKYLNKYTHLKIKNLEVPIADQIAYLAGYHDGEKIPIGSTNKHIKRNLQ